MPKTKKEITHKNKHKTQNSQTRAQARQKLRAAQEENRRLRRKLKNCTCKVYTQAEEDRDIQELCDMLDALPPEMFRSLEPSPEPSAEPSLTPYKPDVKIALQSAQDHHKAASRPSSGRAALASGSALTPPH